MRTPSSTANIESTLRFGLIGCGAIAQLTYLPILTRRRSLRLAALCDSDNAKARALAQRFEIGDYYSDVDDMFAGTDLDAVIVATPNHLHEPHILSALHAGVDVLSERPLALTVAGVERILQAGKRAGKKVVAANPLRYRTDVQALAGFLRGGELGKVFGIRTGEYHRAGSVDGWRLRRAEAGGGAFFEYGFSLVDLALWLLDYPAPRRVSAHFVRAPGNATVEDTMIVLLTCEGGYACTFNVTWSYAGDHDRWAFELLASGGSARLSPLRVVKQFGGRARDVTPTGAVTKDLPLIQSHRAELAHFAAVVRGEAPYEPPVEQLTVLRVIEAAYRSAEEDREVRL